MRNALSGVAPSWRFIDAAETTLKDRADFLAGQPFAVKLDILAGFRIGNRYGLALRFPGGDFRFDVLRERRF
jgi:hypothetical protein